MKKFVILLSAILIVTSAAIAQENIGTRPLGMGGAFAGLADDANAIFLNPAGTGYVRGENASISNKFSADSEYTVLGGVKRTSYGSIGIGYISSSAIIGYLAGSSAIEDEGDTAIRSLNQTLVLSYARQLNDFMVVPEFMGSLSLGTNLKFVSSRISNAKGLSSPDEDTGINFDLAAVLKPNDYLSCGVSLRNVLGGNPGSDDQTGTALELAAGVSGRFLDDTVIVSLENGGVGCEVRMIPELALRIGSDGAYNTAGIGINLNGVGVDYAYLAKEDPVHYLAISIAIDRSKPENDSRQASLGLE